MSVSFTGATGGERPHGFGPIAMEHAESEFLVSLERMGERRLYARESILGRFMIGLGLLGWHSAHRRHPATWPRPGGVRALGVGPRARHTGSARQCHPVTDGVPAVSLVSGRHGVPGAANPGERGRRACGARGPTRRRHRHRPHPGGLCVVILHDRRTPGGACCCSAWLCSSARPTRATTSTCSAPNSSRWRAGSARLERLNGMER